MDDNSRKGCEEDKSDDETIPAPLETRLNDSHASVTPEKHADSNKKKKKIDVLRNQLNSETEIVKILQKNSDLLEISLKKMDDLSNHLNAITEIVEKLQKNSDLPETSLKEKESPKEKVVEYKCCFETSDSDMINPRTIFVEGFDCSFPLDDIESTLIELFSSCGEVSNVHIPFHCKTGAPMGFAFINMRKDEEEALKLNRTRLGGMSLVVTMAKGRSEYYAFNNHLGCGRCHSNLVKHRVRSFYGRNRILKFSGCTVSSINRKYR